jgi:dipeptidyl-peptidase 4
MMNCHVAKTLLGTASCAIVLVCCGVSAAPPVGPSLDWFKSTPGYQQHKKMSREIPGSVNLGALSVTWLESGRAFEYAKQGKRYRYDVAQRRAVEISPPAPTAASKPPAQKPSGPVGMPARGRQFSQVVSPNGMLMSVCRDRNLWLTDADELIEMPVTSEGNEKSRVKYATATWVYGEELYQNTAMWWSPDSRRLAYYRFDESRVPDFYLALRQTQVQDALDVEPYVKAGGPNPVVDLFVYDLKARKSVRIDVRDGKPFDNTVVGHYVYRVQWSPDGKQLLFLRTNRLQNILELAAADPQTGKCRVVVREEWPASWTEGFPEMHFLADGQRFIWASERTGWKNLYLYDLSGKLLATLTNHGFEVDRVVRVVEEAGRVFYTAHDGDNPLKLQLHRVQLDGRRNRRLTDPAEHHTVDIAPDGRHFIDVAQTHDKPPVTRLMNARGRRVEELATSDMSKFEKLGLKRVELLRFKAADGKTELFGMLHRPSNFDPVKKYPLLVNVYAGPGTNGAWESFTLPNTLAEYGFLVATFDSRSAAGRGKRFLDAIYGKLGRVEVDDQAAGVKALCECPYVDRDHVGICGASYGGTMAATCLLRYPDVFHAASASSAVTDYRNYDSIYAERYMGLPQDNKAAYDAARVMTYAGGLKGRLQLFFGTADDNVHPNNTLQLIQALQQAGKSFEVQIGPDWGHSGVDGERMMEFFCQHLLQR